MTFLSSFVLSVRFFLFFISLMNAIQRRALCHKWYKVRSTLPEGLVVIHWWCGCFLFFFSTVAQVILSMLSFWCFFTGTQKQKAISFCPSHLLSPSVYPLFFILYLTFVFLEWSWGNLLIGVSSGIASILLFVVKAGLLCSVSVCSGLCKTYFPACWAEPTPVP